MRKITTYVFPYIAFCCFTSLQLEAVSALPSLLSLAVTVDSKDTIVLSTNTLSNVLAPGISTSGTEEQYLGEIEFNATQYNGTTDYRLFLSQGHRSIPNTETEPAEGWYAILTNSLSNAANDPNGWVALKIYTNVSTTSKPNDPTYITNTAVAHTSTGANLTAVADADYTNFVGILSFYAIDDNGNSMSPGIYQAIFQIGFTT